MDKPQPFVEDHNASSPSIPVAPPKDLIPPMPSVPPMIRTKVVSSSSADLEQDALYAVRRQLAIKELELAKVKQQLSNLVNETWRKNLQVAHLKKEMTMQQQQQQGEVGQPQPVATALPLANLEGGNDNNVQSSPEKGSHQAELVVAGGLLGKLTVSLVVRVASFLSLMDLSSLSRCSKSLRNVLWFGDEVGWQRRLRCMAGRLVVSGSQSAREQLEWLRKHPVCFECGASIVDVPVRLLGMELCSKSECLREATMDHLEASRFFAMTAEDLKGLRCQVESNGLKVYKRSDVRSAALNKFGGHEGLAHRLRVLEKQKMLLSLSKLGKVTRP